MGCKNIVKVLHSMHFSAPLISSCSEPLQQYLLKYVDCATVLQLYRILQVGAAFGAARYAAWN